MGVFLANYYLLWKALHIIAVISWMAGLLYMPRLFVYHSAYAAPSPMHTTFLTMERKLYYYIMYPAQVLSYVFGLILLFLPGIWDSGLYYIHLKIAAVLALSGFHLYLGHCYKTFKMGRKRPAEKFFRAINEIPTFLMILIVVLVVMKPF